MKNEANWILKLDEAYLINGLIRKYKPKNILELGVAKGGSSTLILNAIKDYPGSSLISMDLRKNWLNGKKIGYIVEEKFPELMNKWQLFTGEMPNTFLQKLNLTFDFFFLDTAHVTPGEYFNLIEALPFLKENCIVLLHDIIWHLSKGLYTDRKIYKNRIIPTQINLMSVLVGEKILLNKFEYNFINVGVICLDKNQEKYYLNYFLLMMNFWQYIPTDKQLSNLREFIIKYYGDKQLLRIYDNSIDCNKKIFKKWDKITKKEL